VLEYSDPDRSKTADRGYYFMDSPGNDLESIAGQVGCGCNVVLFITGNGSITNFPFVPTIKIMTTSTRFALLNKDMDFNAGRFQDGKSMKSLGSELFEDIRKCAAGKKTKGEMAAHSQVSIWRNWQQTQRTNPQRLKDATLHHTQLKAGTPNAAAAEANPEDSKGGGGKGVASMERVGLILPTSLCSGQIAQLISEGLNSQLQSKDDGLNRTTVDRFLALPHTEGCGMGYAFGEEVMYKRVLKGHVTHPATRACLLLEHGCEKTHNSAITQFLKKHDDGIPWERIGFASVQLDGGIESVKKKAHGFFERVLTRKKTSETNQHTTENACIAVYAMPIERHENESKIKKRAEATAEDEPQQKQQQNKSIARYFAKLVRTLICRGYRVVIPENCVLLQQAEFLDAVFETRSSIAPTLAFGQAPTSTNGDKGGLYVMACPSSQWGEILTGLASASCVAAICSSAHPVTGHPLVPILQLRSVEKDESPSDSTQEAQQNPKPFPFKPIVSPSGFTADIDVLGEDSDDVRTLIDDEGLFTFLSRMPSTAGDYTDVVFQIPRGKTGVSA